MTVLTCSSTVPKRDDGEVRGGRDTVHVKVPVRMGCGQHKLELDDTGVVFQLTVLDAVQFISNVSSTNIHLGRENHMRKNVNNVLKD